MNSFNRLIVQLLPLMPKTFVLLFAGRYIAGDRLEDAMKAASRLNGDRMTVTIDILGENISGLDEAGIYRDAFLGVLDRIRDEGIDGSISLKLTQLGLKIDRTACVDNLTEVVDKARSQDNFVRIDMEDSTCTDDTIEICLAMHARYERVGTVIQSYLKRSQADVRMLAARGVSLRICKGIYNESPAIAFKRRDEIRDNFMGLVEILFDTGAFAAIATHDPVLVERSKRLIEARGLDSSRYEFQMLLGVAETLRQGIVAGGHDMRVYIPFGEAWYAYSLRRLQENPSLAGHILKNLVIRG